jgi:hypothetical protein
MKIFVPKANEGKLEICCEVSTRADFKRVVHHIEKEFDGRVLNKAEGPGSIIWRLEIEGKEIAIDLSDWGIFPLSITTTDKTAEGLMARIQQSMEQLPAEQAATNPMQRLRAMFKRE